MPLSRRSWDWAAAAAVVLVAVVAGAPALRADFLSDDYGYLAHLHDKPWSHFPPLFASDWSGGIWGHRLDELRPLFAASYRLTGALFGADPVGHHAFNLAFHAASALLVAAMVRLTVPGARGASVAAGCVFAAGAAHAEVLAWITGRVDGLPTFFSLACVCAFLRWRRGGGRSAYAVALLAMAAGLATKEIVVTVPPLLVAFDVILFRQRPAWALARTHAPFVGLAGGWLLLRLAVFGNAVREGRGGPLDLVGKLLSEQPRNLEHLAWPARLAGLTDALALLLLLLPAAVACLLLRSEEGRARVTALLCLGPVWYAVTMAPLAVTYWSARHLYMPAAGVAAALGLLLVPEAPSRWRPVAWASAALLVVLHGVALGHAFEPWVRWGEVSRLVRDDARRALIDIPPGALVVVDGPPSKADGMEVWGYALPFALSPPFVDAGYEGLNVLERADTWCCPEEQWWRDRGPLLERLRRGEGEGPLSVVLLAWDEPRGGLTVLRRELDRSAVAARVTRAMDGPTPRRRTRPRGALVVGTLVQLIRSTPRAGGNRDVMISPP